MNQTVVIIQQYVPAYRRPFFLALRERLQVADMNLVVAAGRPAVQQAARVDEADLPGLIRLEDHQITLTGRSIAYRRIGPVIRGANLIILEQARRNVETYELLLGPRRGRRVALWGHGSTVSREVSRWEHKLLDALTKRADWFFAYTDAGAKHVVSAGFPAERCTVVHNATDTRSLRHAVESVGPELLEAFTRERGLTASSTGLFAGGLDASKRIDFLLGAVSRIAAEVPGFQLLIAGRGSDESKVIAAQRAGSPVILLGDCRGEALAVAARASDLILMPGRVGLIAVDSFAMGLPVITTSWPHHAPEFEYLTAGVDSIVTEDDVERYASAVISLLKDPGRRRDLQSACLANLSSYSIEDMVSNFADGILAAIN
jgi:glycosyltransferase involved in cell wall biosynthesis